MTDAETLERTIALVDAWMENELERAELWLIDHGATSEEVQAAVGFNGYHRRALQANRDAQIRATARWLSATAKGLPAALRRPDVTAPGRRSARRRS